MNVHSLIQTKNAHSFNQSWENHLFEQSNGVNKENHGETYVFQKKQQSDPTTWAHEFQANMGKSTLEQSNYGNREKAIWKTTDKGFLR